MSTEQGKDNTKGSEKDYGFPFVKVTPLVVKTKPKAELKPDPVADPVSDAEKPIQIKRASKSISRPIESLDKRKRSQLPLLLSLVFLVLIVLGSMAYFLYWLPSQEKELDPITQTQEITPEPPVFEPVPESEESAEQEEESMLEKEPEITETEVQSPISPSGIGNLTPITERGERPMYYIIVGSLPNERLAKEEAQKILNKGRDIWMISPFGDIRNYRLSVGRYETLASATEALEEAKMEFGESLWILKY